jgi:hypothetical protein
MKYLGRTLNLGRIAQDVLAGKPLTAEDQAIYDEALPDPRRIMEAVHAWVEHLEQMTRAFGGTVIHERHRNGELVAQVRAQHWPRGASVTKRL